MINRAYFTETYYDMSIDIATRFAQAIREAWLTGKDFEGEKRQGFFLSSKRGFEDKLYVGNIHRIENHLYWNDEELADDDEIVNVVVIDGPVTRDGDGCSYGSKDHRDQILYANTIPQVKGHIFILNTPGGAASSRIDYEQAIADCREKGKATVAWVDGMCCSAGQLVASLCDRTLVMNGRNTMGCIGTMCAFWGVPHNTVDHDGYRYIELVSVSSPEKNAEYREAVAGNTEKLQAELDKLGEEFRETVRQNRPLVKEEHLTGKTFDAQDVIGALVDEVGDYTRAIEVVFELANGTMPSARSILPEDPETATGQQEEQEDLATLNEQQRVAIATLPGETLTIAEGHVTKDVETMFGTMGQEIATPQNNDNMEQENITNTTAIEQTETAVVEEVAVTEAPAQDKTTVQEEQVEQTITIMAGGANSVSDVEIVTTTMEDASAEEQEMEQDDGAHTEEEAAKATELELDKMADALYHAVEMVSERDKTIEDLKADKDTLSNLVEKYNEAIDEQRGTIEKLQKQVEELKAEVKELSAKPAPMTSADSGVPADNGTGEAPKVNKHQRIRRGMSYKQIREATKE